jgi:hypothetical protein
LFVLFFDRCLSYDSWHRRILRTIGRPPYRTSDKQRLAFRTDADAKGRGTWFVWRNQIAGKIELDIIGTDRYRRVGAVRFLPWLILLVFGFYGVSAFGEETPAGQPPVPDNVMPAKRAISANEGYVDRSHAFFDRKINRVVTWFDGLFGDTARPDTRRADIP